MIVDHSDELSVEQIIDIPLNDYSLPQVQDENSNLTEKRVCR